VTHEEEWWTLGSERAREDETARPTFFCDGSRASGLTGLWGDWRLGVVRWWFGVAARPGGILGELGVGDGVWLAIWGVLMSGVR
jgi:hypothetical protein